MRREKELEVGPDEAGLTLAAVIRRAQTGLTWSAARALCERGQVMVSGQIVRDGAFRVRAGDVVRVNPHAPRQEKTPLASIVYEDTHLVVVDKPAGLVSVPFEPGERGTALDQVRAALRKRGRGATALFVVHRLDKDTSGLMAFARTRLAERELGRAFRIHAVKRVYLCVAHGSVKTRRFESRLVDDRGDGLRGSSPDPSRGKLAITEVRVMERLPGASFCRVELQTGKTHQIRIHLAEAGHPLVGERVYIRDFLARGGEPIAASRLLLHATTLAFRHPVTGAPIELRSPLPADYAQELDRLRRDRERRSD